MNLANKITIFRIILVPIFLACMWIDFKYNQYFAAIIFIIAASSDSLDGYIARKRNQITDFGKLMDPLADKILVTSALICLVEKGNISSLVAIIIISREFMITGLRTVAASKGIVIAASPWAKLKTITQLVAITLILLNNFPFNKINFPFDMIMLYIAVIITVISGIDYIYKNRKLINTN